MSNEIDKDYLRERLQTQKQQTLVSLESAQQSAQPVELDQARQGRLSRIDAIQQQAMSQDRVHRLQLELKRIDAALQRLDTDDYGYCIKCGDGIEWQRLKSNPAVLKCQDCID